MVLAYGKESLGQHLGSMWAGTQIGCSFRGERVAVCRRKLSRATGSQDSDVSVCVSRGTSLGAGWVARPLLQADIAMVEQHLGCFVQAAQPHGWHVLGSSMCQPSQERGPPPYMLLACSAPHMDTRFYAGALTALVSHCKKDPFSGMDVVRDSDEIVCLYEPSLLCLGQEHVPCMRSTFRSHGPKTSSGQAPCVRKTSGLILGDTRGRRAV